MTRPDRPVGESPDAARDRWRETLRAKALKGAPERREPFETSSGIVIRDLYTAADTAALDEDRDLGRPGEYPFTRGVQPTMYRGRFWTMRQYAGFATAEETNRRFRYLLEQGQTGLSVAFDLPTQMGYDSDAPDAEGEVGRVGVPISSLADMEILLDGLPLGQVSTSMTINATAPILLALYVAAAEAQGVERAAISGTIQNDILKEYIARGTWIYPPRPSMRLVTDVFEFCAAELPNWNTISISRLPHARGRGDRSPGARLHAGRRDRLRRGGRRAWPRRRRLRRPAVVLLRRLARAVRGGRQVPGGPPHVGDDHARAVRRPPTRARWVCRFHVQTAGSSLTAQSVDNNVVRTTIQALAAVLGGAQSLHTNSRDEALALPTEEAARLALRTQQIIAYESGVDRDARPARRLLLRRDA